MESSSENIQSQRRFHSGTSRLPASSQRDLSKNFHLSELEIWFCQDLELLDTVSCRCLPREDIPAVRGPCLEWDQSASRGGSNNRGSGPGQDTRNPRLCNRCEGPQGSQSITTRKRVSGFHQADRDRVSRRVLQRFPGTETPMGCLKVAAAAAPFPHVNRLVRRTRS